jgi:hypothetical protein
MFFAKYYWDGQIEQHAMGYTLASSRHKKAYKFL